MKPEIGWMIVGTLIAGALVAIWRLPKRQVRKLKTLEPKDSAELENEYRRTMVQVLTGVGLVLSLFFTWSQVASTRAGVEENKKLVERQLDMARQDQLSRRFAAALDQFADSTLVETRLAGIFALERIALDSESDRPPILRMLLTYVRSARSVIGARPAVVQRPYANPCRDTLPLPPAIQSSLDVVKRVSWHVPDPEHRSHRINLGYTDLRNAVLDSASLRFAVFNGSYLQRAQLLHDTKLYRADFIEAHLEQSWISDLRRARVYRAGMCHARLDGARLDSADFRLTDLSGARLHDAVLRGASFDGVDLSSAEGLTAEQLREAIISNTTKLPPDLDSLLAGKKVPSALPDTAQVARCAC